MGDGDLQTKLQLRFGRTVELLIDRGIGRVENDEGSCTVGVAFEEGIRGGRDVESST